MAIIQLSMLVYQRVVTGRVWFHNFPNLPSDLVCDLDTSPRQDGVTGPADGIVSLACLTA